MNYFTILVVILYFCCTKISADSQVYCLGGYNENRKALFSVSKLDQTTNQWESVTEMTTTRIQFGAAAIGKKIYVAAGDSETQKLDLFEVYDIETNSWNELPSVPTARDCHGMEVLNGNIYVAGGYDSSGHRLKSVWKYFPQTNT